MSENDLLTRLLLDQSERWRRGRARPIEAYLRDHPDLEGESLLDLISNEIYLRTSSGENPDPEEYRRRFPHLATAIEIQFVLHGAVEGTSGLLPPDLNVGRAGTDPVAIPGYEIRGELGRGAMGVVYQAVQVSLGRAVALKVLQSGGRGAAATGARFRAEAELVAGLRHANIVQIYEVGETAGHCWFSLELVEGGTLAQRLGRPLQPRVAAAIAADVARAVHYAHQHGIIHRDLKPSNILLDGSGRPKVTDFGLARRLEGGTRLTRTGDILGTPSYMAPEQARGRSDVGVAADVYALGAILYECLTGRPPFRADTALATLILADTTEAPRPRQLSRRVPLDLEAICLKCLQKQPAERYASAEALAEDLTRFLTGRPVAARPVGTVTRLWKWSWRSPAHAALAVGALLALVVLLAALGFHEVALRRERDRACSEQEQAALQRDAADSARAEAEAQRDLAREAIRQAEAQRDLAREAIRQAEAQRDETRAARAEAERQQRESRRRLELARHSLYARQLAEATAAWRHEPDRAAALLQDPARCPLDLREFTWGLLTRAITPAPERFPGQHGVVLAVALAPDGRTLAAAAADGSVRLWDAESKRELVTLAAHKGRACAVAFAPDGKLLASAGADGVVGVWDTAGKPTRKLIGHHGPVFAATFAPGGRLLATGGADGAVRLWDTAVGKEPLVIAAHQGAVHTLAFSPDGKALASAGEDRIIKFWNVEDGAPRGGLGGHARRIYALAFAPDGRTLASADADGVVGLWDATTGATRITLPGHVGHVCTLAFSPDGRTLASGAEGFAFLEVQRGGEIKTWDTITGQPLDTTTFPAGVYSLAWFPDGRHLAVATGTEVQRRPAVRSLEDQTLPSQGAGLLALAVNGQSVVTAGVDGKLLVKDKNTGRITKTLAGHVGPVSALAVRPGGMLASGGADGVLRIWDAATLGSRLLIPESHRGGVTCVAFSPDGRSVASGGYDRLIVLWDTTTGRKRATLTGHTDRVAALVFSADGATLFSAGFDGTVRSWAVATGQEVRVVHVPGNGLSALAATAEGRLLAAGGLDGTVHLLDPASGVDLQVLTGHRGPVWCLAWSPDDRTLAVGAGPEDAARLQAAGEVRLWDPQGGHLLAVLTGHARAVTGLVFSADGRTLTSASLDGTVKCWVADAPDGPVALPVHAFPVKSLALSGDGRLLLTAAGGLAGEPEAVGGAVTLWDAEKGIQLGSGIAHSRPVRCVAFSGDGKKGASGDAGGEVRLWDARTGKGDGLPLRPQPGPVLALSLDAAGKLLAVAGQAGVRLVEVEGGRERALLRGHVGPVLAVALSPDGGVLASGGWDGDIRLWDARTGKERQVLAGHAGPVRVLAFAPDGKTLASGAGSADRLHGYRVGEVSLWDLPTGKVRIAFPAHALPVAALAFSGDGRTLWTSTERGPGDRGEVEAWDVSNGKERRALPWPLGAQAAGALPAGGPPLLLALRGDTPFVWDATQGAERPLRSFRPGRILVARFAPGGRTVALGGLPPLDEMARAGEIRLWDATTAEPLGWLRESATELRTAALRPDGQVAATGNTDGSVRLWDLANRRVRVTLQAHQGAVESVAFAPDGHVLATGGADGFVKVWDADTGEPRGTFRGHTGSVTVVLFTPDGLASAGEDGTIRRWGMVSEPERGLLCGHGGPVHALALARQAGTLASLGKDGRVLVWPPGSDKPQTLAGAREHPARSLALTADGHTLALGGRDGVLRLWDVAAGCERAAIPVLEGEITCVAPLEGGAGWVCAGADGVVRLQVRGAR